MKPMQVVHCTVGFIFAFKELLLLPLDDILHDISPHNLTEVNSISCTTSTVFFLYIYIWSPATMTVVICYLLLFSQKLFKLIFSQFSFFNLTVISFPSLLGFYCSHLNITWKKRNSCYKQFKKHTKSTPIK